MTRDRYAGWRGRASVLGLVLWLCSLTTSAARADTLKGSERFLLGESGTVPGWLITAVHRQTASREAHPGVEPSDAAARVGALWVTRDGWLGLEPLFKPQASGFNIVRAAARLSLAEPLKGWLLLRLPGTLLVQVNGRPALQRATPFSTARGWEAVTLQLDAGVHTIDLTSQFQRETWGLSAAIIDESGRAPPGAQWWVPIGTEPATKNAEPFDVKLSLRAESPAGLELDVGAENGTRVTKPAQVVVSIGSSTKRFERTLSGTTWPNGTTPVASTRMYIGTVGELLQLVDANESWSLDIRIGKHRVARKLRLSRPALLAWKRSVEVLAANPPPPAGSLDVARTSLQSAQRELSQAMVEAQEPSQLQRLAERVTRLATGLSGQKAVWTLPGIHQLAWRSSADASLQRFALHVPASIDDGRPRPLVIVLHGYNGNGKRALEAFLDTSPEATEPRVDGYVLAPDAHANAFYRGPAERDLLEILDWAVQALAVDKTRVTITGASMGGTGTAEIAFHYPDRFAALAPLCGYQSFFVRRDTARQPLRDWERRLMHRFSPASSADAGRYLPMYLAHGLKDKPLENSRVLTARYQQLGYSLVEDWPDLGHAVWKRTWAKAGLFSWLSQKVRIDDPSRVTLAVTALRHGSSHWLSLTELDAHTELSQIDAEWKHTNHLVVSTSGVRGFAIGATSRSTPEQPVQVQIDGARLTLPARAPMHFSLVGGKWTGQEPTKALRKSVHAEGPWPDLWSEKLVFVYGSLKVSTIGTNRSVANAFASSPSAGDSRYPVLSDVEFSRSAQPDYVPILVGTLADHDMLSRWGDKLPIRVEQGAVTFGSRSYQADRVGAVFVYPNPDNPKAVVGVITAPTPEGLWQATLLPTLIPDFVIFDARTSAAAGQPILGHSGKVLAAGFFGADWSLPERMNDPLDHG